MEFNVDINIYGVNFTELAEKITPEIEAKLIDRLATLAAFTMYTEAPHKSGLTANTIKKQVNGLTAVIGPTTPYASYIEYGTAPHIITVSPGGCLAFEVGGETVFTKLVHHPGTRPNPFVARTTELIRQEIPTLFTEVWQDALKENQQ